MSWRVWRSLFDLEQIRASSGFLFVFPLLMTLFYFQLCSQEKGKFYELTYGHNTSNKPEDFCSLKKKIKRSLEEILGT